MDRWFTILGAVLSIFSVVAVGGVIRTCNWLTEETDQVLMKLVIRVLFPCLIFTTIVGNTALSQGRNILLPPLVGYVTALLGFLIAYEFAKRAGAWSGLTDQRQRRTFAMCVGMFNYSYIPIPLMELLFPGNQGTLGVLFIHNLGVETALWTAGMVILTGQMSRQWWKGALNPPTFAIAAGLLVNWSGLIGVMPGFAMRAAGMLGQCAIPMALLLIGATIADHLHEAGIHGGRRIITWACLLRLGLLPALFLGLAMILPASRELRQVMVIQASMPSAVFPILIARHYGGDTPTALRVVLGTSLFSLLTASIWLSGGLSLFHLKTG